MQPINSSVAAAHSINCGLIRQLKDDGQPFSAGNNQPMVENDDTFNTRFSALFKATGLSLAGLSDAIHELTGVRISPQALHKYQQGGNIDEPQLEALCLYFHKPPAWFRYGVEAAPQFKFTVLGEMVDKLPEAPKQMVLELLKYEYSGSAAKVVSEPGTSISYADFVTRVIEDMKLKRDQQQSPPKPPPDAKDK